MLRFDQLAKPGALHPVCLYFSFILQPIFAAVFFLFFNSFLSSLLRVDELFLSTSIFSFLPLISLLLPAF